MLGSWQKYHHSVWSGILLMIRTLVGLGLQKIVALFYGPVGTTLFSHFQNLVTLFTQPVQDAVANGIINAFPKKSIQKVQLIGASIIFLIFLTLSSAVFLLINSQVNQDIFDFSLHNWLLIIPSILLFCFGLLVSAIYVVNRKLKLYSFILIIQWLVFFTVVRLIDLELNQFLIFWLFIQAFFSIILIFPIHEYLKFNFKIEKEVIVHFKQFLLMALTIWLSSKWVDYFIREYAVQEFGTIQTGLWQSVVRISEAYRGMMISFLFLSFYPMLSQKLASHNLNMGSLKKYYGQYLIFAVVFLSLVFQFDEFILETLYDSQYVKANDLFQFQILGDVFAFLAFPFSIYLIASVRTKTYIFTELVSAIIFVSLILMNVSVGIDILVYAHIIRFACFFLLVSLLSLKSFKDVR